MATTVRSVLNRAAAILNDEEFVRWEEAELLEWLNDGQRVISRGPSTDAYVLRATMTAASGSVQALPSDGIRLVDIVRNVADGSAIVQADYATANMLGSTWRGGTAGPAENFFYDERNPKQFELYPPQVGGEQIEIIYNARPADTTVTGNISIDDMFADALVDYVCYRGFSKDTEDSGAVLNRATAHYRAFTIAVGLKDATDSIVEPARS